MQAYAQRRTPSRASCLGCGVNLRRRGSDAIRKEKPERPADGDWWVSFAFPTDASVLTILQNYTRFGQFFADFVAFDEVPPLSRSLPLRNHRLYICVAQPASGRAVP